MTRRPLSVLALLFTPLVHAQQPYDGVTFFQPLGTTTSYLVDNQGALVHTWAGTATPGASQYLLPNGNLLRTQRLLAGPGGIGGGVEEVAWDASVLWSFRYASADFVQHHDVEVLPNGNVLMVAWEFLTRQEAIDSGRDPALINGPVFGPEHIVEVRPHGTNGVIVWEWHAWDHLIQDFDASRANFGVVADHPELIDLNYPPVLAGADWQHVNAIDYDPHLDQILLSVHAFDEIWVIDHSTTTAEAAGHTGGNSGRGGDVLYRWGNPAAYRAGTPADQQLFGQHDAQWIPHGLPGAGNFLVFNNGVGRPAGAFSSVDELVSPVDAHGQYPLAPGAAHGPAAPVWSYVDPLVPTTFFSPILSGAQRLPNGNTLICEGVSGHFFEVTSAMQTVWEFNTSALSIDGFVFRATRHAYSDLALGTSYCGPAAASSTGGPARISATGTGIAGQPLELFVAQLPLHQFGYFLASQHAGSSMPPGSSGTLCLSGAIARFNAVHSILRGPVGSIEVDSTAIPTHPPVAVHAGETWNFQCWYRDGATSNFTDAVAVTFL